MTSSPQLKVLGDFFRVRRSEVSPDAIPRRVVSNTARRRVRGLRREEVAQLAAVSVDYYTRVEQGRLVPSDQVFASLCRTFGLSPEQRAYAEDLLNRARGYVLSVPGREAAHDRLQLLLDQLTELPAIVLGPRMDVLAWTAPAAALLTDFGRIPIADRNYVAITFTDPAVRDLYEDWELVARTCVGILRREATKNPDDPELAALVGRLSIADKDFRRWWAEHRVAEQAFGAKVIVHPIAGRMLLNWDSFSYAGAARQQLVLWSTDAGTPDAAALARLVATATSAEQEDLPAD
ncbi:helix-turn-helix protein [Propionibacteriaceae bacterium ES.041]|uniref:helix-turn-helix domain-containing protein n=1 Tax=Enemella evansiae TaxID=2016499 RepID=UPI000B96E4DD|nr:helix-turn-helix transcriptional regulator [Enemella evansiae]OYO01098.1 transcriptional regulator [Enemella evansiae]PFG68149.1 helix-turn-helix protein [Propionibacteriaceae bacterium ES.041]